MTAFIISVLAYWAVYALWRRRQAKKAAARDALRPERSVKAEQRRAYLRTFGRLPPTQHERLKSITRRIKP